MPSVRRDYVVLGLLLVLLLSIGIAVSAIDRRMGKTPTSRSLPIHIPENGIGEPIQLTDCRWTPPTDVHPNFLYWSLDRETRLLTISSWEWDEGEDKVFPYLDPVCLGNPPLRRYIEHALERAAPEGVTEETAGGGP